MIIQEGKDEFAVSCDDCSWEDYFDGDFRDVVSQIKRLGWKITKVADEWLHTCPECVAGRGK